MKKLTIGNITVDCCETAEDLPIKRAVAMKEYILYKERGLDIPSLVKTFKGFIQAFDEKSPSQMLISMMDFVKGAENIVKGEDPDQMLFALITFEDGEDKGNTDKTLLKNKLERLSKEGLSQGLVEKEVENFMKGWQPHLSSYFQTSSVETQS